MPFFYQGEICEQMSEIFLLAYLTLIFIVSCLIGKSGIEFL